MEQPAPNSIRGDWCSSVKRNPYKYFALALGVWMAIGAISNLLMTGLNFYGASIHSGWREMLVFSAVAEAATLVIAIYAYIKIFKRFASKEFSMTPVITLFVFALIAACGQWILNYVFEEMLMNGELALDPFQVSDYYQYNYWVLGVSTIGYMLSAMIFFFIKAGHETEDEDLILDNMID